MTRRHAPDPNDPAREAIPRLLDAHGGQIYGLGLRLCGGPEDAQDLVQETFLNAFRKWDQFEGRSDPATWLYTIAVRACRRLNRKRSGEPRHIESLSELVPAGDEALPIVPANDDDPLEEQLRRDAAEAVERALVTIPLRFRLPLVLKDIAEFSIPEVGEVLGVKEATVKTRIHRGRLLLRKALAEALPGEELPPSAHPRSVCLSLLHAKLEALDRGVAFPLPPTELCSRCRRLFSTLDLAREVCRGLAGGELPEPVRRLLVEEMEGNGAGGRS